jgi:hypothetical protein
VTGKRLVERWGPAPFEKLGPTMNRTMTSHPTLTKQGVRDLNHYGPKPSKARAEPSKSRGGGDTAAVPVVSEKDQTISSPAHDTKREAP